MSESNNNEDLLKIINLLPLDQLQSKAIYQKIKLLDKNKAEEIADKLKTALSELPKAVKDFNTALTKAIETSQVKHYDEWSLARQDTVKEKVANLSMQEVLMLGTKPMGTNLIRANLSNQLLIGADLIGAKLSGANLSGANLSGAKLIKTYLNEADLSGADLSGAKLIKTNLSKANLSKAIVEGALFISTEGIDKQQQAELQERGAIFEN